MDPTLTAAMVGGLVSLLGAATYYGLSLLSMKGRARENAGRSSATYKERMDKLSKDLIRASEEMDQTLEEIAAVKGDREKALVDLEVKLEELSGREQELQQRVDALKQVPVPAVKYLLEETSKAERRGARRDYVLFGLGVLVSTVLTVMLKLVFDI
jgi:hypothetical protein